MRAPLLPLTVALVAGILMGATWPAAWPAALPRPAAAPAFAFILVSALGGAVPLVRAGRVFTQEANVHSVVRYALCVVVACALAGGLVLGARVSRATHAHPLRTLVGLGNGPLPADVRDEGPHILRLRLEDDAARSTFGATLTARVLAVDGHQLGGDEQALVRIGVGGQVNEQHVAGWAAGRELEAPVWLRRASPYLNPGLADQEAVLARRGIVLVGQIKSPRLVEPRAPATPLQEWAIRTRAFVRAAITGAVAPWSARSAAVAAAILIGDRSGLDEATELRLQKAGTFHVVAISGGNVAIFTGLVLGVLAWSRARPPIRALAALIVVVLFAAVVTRSSSVWRATLMAAAALVANALDRPASALNLVALAVAAMIVAQPAAVFDPGLWLTVGATLGILSAMPRWLSPAVRSAGGLRSPPRSAVAPRALREAWGVVLATLAAEAVVMPLGAWWFNRVTLAGIGLNLVAVPAMAATQVAGLAAVVLWPVMPWAAQLAGGVTHAAVTVLVDSAVVVEWLPWVSWRVPAPPVALLVGYYGTLAAAWTGAQPGRATWGLLLAACWAGVATGAAWPGPRRLTSPPLRGAEVRHDWRVDESRTLRVTFFDVGQGDATLIQASDGPSMLVDAGGTPGDSRFDIGARITVPALWAQGVRALDTLVVTHGDPDHAEGALAVIDDMDVAEVWEGIPVPTDALGTRLRARAGERGSRWREVRAPLERAFGTHAWLRVLHPPVPDWERRRVRNDDSVVIEVTRGAVGLQLTGDVGREVEGALVSRLRPGVLNVVKVAHHGSAGSSGRAWVAASRPTVAIASAGRHNRFNHPAPAVVARYERAGAVVLRTDRDGAVEVVTDGRILRVATARGGRFGWRVGPRGADRPLVSPSRPSPPASGPPSPRARRSPTSRRSIRGAR